MGYAGQGNLMKFNFDKLKSIPAKTRKLNIRKFNWTTVLAILSYLNILVLIPLFASRNKPLVRFHAKQGVILLAFFAVTLFSFYVPALFYLFVLFYALCIIAGIINVARGGEKHLPLIGKLANRL